MDSVREETLRKLESLGVAIKYTMDENETDYTKSLRVLDLYCRERDIKVIVSARYFLQLPDLSVKKTSLIFNINS